MDELRDIIKQSSTIKQEPDISIKPSPEYKTRINDLRDTAKSLFNDFIASMAALELDIKEAIDETPKEVLYDLGYHSVEDIINSINVNKK
jgi:hypothetical protein